jgi:two-component system heavy metal sensor histidine kinase CusS
MTSLAERQPPTPWARLTRTLRFRVLLWNASVVMFTAISLLAAVRFQVEFTLRGELDGILQDELEEAANEISAGQYDSEVLTRIVDRETYGHHHLREYVEIKTPDGTLMAVNTGAPSSRPLTENVPDNVPTTVGGYRVVRRVLGEKGGPPRAIVVVGALASAIDDQMRTLDRIVALTALVSLIGAPIVGHWLAGKAIDPLAEMTRTAAKLHPEQLHERLPNRETGDELDQLAMTVNHLLDRIFDYLQEHRESLANAAHELRSPLAAIRSSAEVALQRERSTQEYEELLESIIEQGTTLGTLVNQLLLLSEMEREHLERQTEAVPLDQVVTRAVNMFQGVAEQKDVDLKITNIRGTTISGNRMHLREVVNNLLDNAIKFTEPGGTVTVDLGTEEAERAAVLRVTDSGIGIPGEDLPKVFDRFFRSDRSRNREKPGTGLGLSICKSVVESHGGTIEVSSSSLGTTFKIRLPLMSLGEKLADGIAAAKGV